MDEGEIKAENKALVKTPKRTRRATAESTGLRVMIDTVSMFGRTDHKRDSARTRKKGRQMGQIPDDPEGMPSRWGRYHDDWARRWGPSVPT